MFPAARDEERNTKAQPRKPIILIIPISFNPNSNFFQVTIISFIVYDNIINVK